MTQTKLSYILFAALIAIFTFHFLGLKFYWYQRFFGYDTPMHIAGGAWVALAAIYFLKYRNNLARHMSQGVFALVVLASAIGVGILWEIYEYSMDIFKFQIYTFSTIPAYIRLDSFHDLVNDFIGALIIFIFWLYFSEKSRSRTDD